MRAHAGACGSARRYRVEYEQGEGTRPDFRLYDRAGAYVGAVEVVTLFLRDDWAVEEWRHAVLVDALNARLRLTTHSVELEVRRWDSTPSAQHMARWIECALDELREDPDALPLDQFGDPEKTYATRAVEVAVRFLPLAPAYMVEDGAPVGAGKRQSVSAVFSLHEWYPGGPYRPRIMRFDNPMAAAPLPIDALPFNGHWGVVERVERGVRAGWLVPPGDMIPALAL